MRNIWIVILMLAFDLISATQVLGVRNKYMQSLKPVAEVEMTNIVSTSLQLYILDNGRLPTTEQGLKALMTKTTVPPIPKNWNGPYVEKILDPWGNPYGYRLTNSFDDESSPSYVLWSLGQDGVESDDDIVVRGPKLKDGYPYKKLHKMDIETQERIKTIIIKSTSTPCLQNIKFEVSDDWAFMLSGESFKMSTTFDLVKALEDSMFFEYVKAKEVRTEARAGRDIVVFELNGSISADNVKDGIGEQEIVDLEKQLVKNHLLDSWDDVKQILKQAEDFARLSLPEGDSHSLAKSLEANNKVIELYREAKEMVASFGGDTSVIDVEEERVLLASQRKWKEEQEAQREKETQQRFAEARQKYSLEERLNQKVTLEFFDMYIGDILKFLAFKSSLDIQLPDDLSGKGSIDVVKKPIKELIDNIVEDHGLVYIIKNNVIMFTVK